MKKTAALLALALLLAAPAGAEEPLAYAATQSVLINGEVHELQAYALKDANGFSTNYVKLRDMAVTLSGTTARFNVDWDGGVVIRSKSPYLTPNGQEGQTPYSGDQPYSAVRTPATVDDQSVWIDAFVITDDEGNGSTYYKLRDLGRALDFSVTWLGAEEGVRIDTSISYQD